MSEDLPAHSDAALVEGSGYYYVARFCAPERRTEVGAWLSWFEHIDSIALQARDPGVSRLKLDWWREEAGLARQAKGRHPLARALEAHLRADWQVREMDRTLSALEQQILHSQPADPEEFREIGIRLWGSRFRLLSGSANQEQHEIADTAGHYYASVITLQQLAPRVISGHLPLPRSTLQEHGLAIADLQSAQHSDKLEKLSETLLRSARAEWQQAQSVARQSPDFDPVLRLTAQADRIARLLSRQHFQTHLSIPTPMPIGLLWSAWRGR